LSIHSKRPYRTKLDWQSTMRSLRTLAALLTCMLAALPSLAQAGPSSPQPPIDHLRGGKVPVYPPIAIAAGIGGSVDLSISVHNGVVTSVSITATSSMTAQKWLTVPAQMCAASWRFSKTTNGAISAAFTYSIAKPGAGDTVSLRFVKGRIRVDLRAERPKPDVTLWEQGQVKPHSR